MGMSVYMLCILWFCDILITCVSLAGLALHLRLGERASEIDIVRILRSAEESVCFSLHFWAYLPS